MNWQNVPIGMIRYDELLNALLAIWKIQYNNAVRDSSEFAKGYLTGFEEGLDAIAQIAGLIEGFETGKATHRAHSPITQLLVDTIPPGLIGAGEVNDPSSLELGSSPPVTRQGKAITLKEKGKDENKI